MYTHFKQQILSPGEVIRYVFVRVSEDSHDGQRMGVCCRRVTANLCSSQKDVGVKGILSPLTPDCSVLRTLTILRNWKV